MMAVRQIVGFTLLLFSMGAWSSARAEVTFTPITEGAIVEDAGYFNSCAWGDYDNDGDVDVVVGQRVSGRTAHFYQNNGDGTFSRITEGIIATDPVASTGPSWADQDNDGDLDLYVATHDNTANVFYRNDGDGTFTKVMEGDWVNTPDLGDGAAWGDYDNDGSVDLYVAIDGNRNLLYHNNGDGTMTPVNTEANAIAGDSHGCVWTDFDGDGDVDLFVSGQDKAQFRNDGDGIFTWITSANGGILGATMDVGFASADYDNDGDLDLLHGTWAPARLYLNEGEAGFVRQANIVLPDGGSTRPVGLAWGDYDNDGHQDLFISNSEENNLLYHNDGDGSFTLITESPVVSADLDSGGSAWVDYDNDGDLDLFVANGFLSNSEQSCELSRNDGGTNNWIILSLVGIASNRSAIGAKVRAQATIDGKEITQLREIYGGGNGQSQADMRVHFGLGDATSVDTLRIEWPSGAVQVLRDVAAKQFLEIEELIDPLIGGLPIGFEDWFWSDWFGYYYTASAPWIYHAEHGFIYRDPESTNAGMFVYDDAIAAWWYTQEELYPFIYAFDPPADSEGTDIDSAWLWYFEDTKTPRVFGVADGDSAGSYLFFGP